MSPSATIKAKKDGHGTIGADQSSELLDLAHQTELRDLWWLNKPTIVGVRSRKTECDRWRKEPVLLTVLKLEGEVKSWQKCLAPKETFLGCSSKLTAEAIGDSGPGLFLPRRPAQVPPLAGATMAGGKAGEAHGFRNPRWDMGWADFGRVGRQRRHPDAGTVSASASEPSAIPGCMTTPVHVQSEVVLAGGVG
ncbi:hypothetical protein V2G26_017597 [Clonostachys chloroleuca]